MSFTVTRHSVVRCLRELRGSFTNHQPFRNCVSVSNAGKSKIPILKATLAGVGVTLLGGTGYSYMKQEDDTLSVYDVQTKANSNVVPTLPNVDISRRVSVVNDKSGLQLMLFQYPTCPFCCKVRAFLDYYGISYDVVEVNPVLRQQIKWSKYKKVPILLAKSNDGYLQFNDSSMIVSALATYLKDRKLSMEDIQEYYPLSFLKEDPKKSEIMNKYFVMHSVVGNDTLEHDKDERVWRKWADEVLVHTLSPNVYRTTDEALQAFNWFSEVGEWDKLFSWWEKILVVYVGAYAMWLIGKKLKKRHNLNEDVRRSLYEECDKWMAEINKRGSEFLGGKNPNLADLAVYGVLSSIEGCDAFKELLQNTKIGTWYYKMKDNVQKHSGQISIK